MAIPNGPLSLSDIQAAFGGSNPISLSEYYRGGALVPIGTATSPIDGVPISTSGTIRMGMFRGVSATTSVSLTISANTANYNIFTAAGSPAGVANVTLNITGVGTTVFSNSSSLPALTTGTGWAVGSTVTITNAGIISGGPGDNGQADNSGAGVNGNGLTGQAGGTAFVATIATSFTNSGTVAGGGGQGGFGGNGNSPSGTFGTGGRGGAGRGGLAALSSVGGAGSGNAATTGTGGQAQGTGIATGVPNPGLVSALSNGNRNATTPTASASNCGGGGVPGGGWGATGGSHTTFGRGRNAAGALTSNGGVGGAGGLAVSGKAFVNGGAGITTGTVLINQT